MNSILLVCGLALGLGLLHVCEARQIIKNEDDLIGTCTKSCDEIHEMYGKFDCRKISGCTKSSSGWNRGFVRCDYCRCECEVNNAEKDVLVEKKRISVTEPDLLGTCTKTCDRKGLVRTNFRGCQEVRDCWRSSKGWTRGFVRCDYCACNCINRRYAKKYRLENVKYDFSEADLKELENGKPIMVSETILRNSGRNTQEAIRVVRYTTSESTSMSTTHNTEVGLTVTVGATAKIEGVFELSTSVERSIRQGFSYTSGSTKVVERNDEIRVSVKVPPRSSIKAEVIGTELKIDIPYTATLVIVHDGGETRKGVKGVLSDVHTARIRVNYKAAKPL